MNTKNKSLSQSRLHSLLLSAALLITLMLSSQAYAGVFPAQVTPKAGKNYYTQHNIWVEKERSLATNYSRGELIPFNTLVKLVSVSGKKIVLDVDGRTITVINVPKHTQRNAQQIATRYLNPRKISLKGIGGERRADMESGVLRLGMSKDQVLATRGYPPRHKTPSTKSNTWTYWTSRFVQRTLVFEKGRLKRGRGLY